MKSDKLLFIVNIVVAVILSAGVVLFPYASLPLSAVSAVFFTVNCYRYSIGRSVTLALVAMVVMVAGRFYSGITVDAFVTALSGYCLSVLSGAVTGVIAKNKMNFRAVITGGTIANLLYFVIDFALYKFYYKLDLGEELINRPVAEFITMYEEIISNSGMENAKAITAVLGDVQWAMQQALAAVVPSMLIIFCGIIAYAMFLIGRKILYRRYDVVMDYPHFSQLRMPRSMSLVFTILFVVSMFMDASPLAGAITNIIIIFCALYFMCGFSVVDFFFKKKTNLHWSLRIVIYAVAFTMLSVIGIILPFANIITILLFLGVIDGMADFRKLRSGGDIYEE